MQCHRRPKLKFLRVLYFGRKLKILLFFNERDVRCRLWLAASHDAVALEIKQLWYEYEDCTSEEARVVKDLDKMEMIVQADDYEKGERALEAFGLSLVTLARRNHGLPCRVWHCFVFFFRAKHGVPLLLRLLPPIHSATPYVGRKSVLQLYFS